MTDTTTMNTQDHPLSHLFDNNDAWVKRQLADDPQFFARLADQQAPEYLWIGCSDSRVPANQIIGLPPGEVFVHRNIANVVVHTDLNCLSVIQFAVDILRVKHIMVVVQDVRERHAALLDEWPVGEARYRRLIELNAIEQVVNVCRTTIVNDAWARGQSLTVHALVYGVHDGRMRNLGMAVSNFDSLEETYRRCVASLTARGEHAPDNDIIAADAARLDAVAHSVADTLKHGDGNC